MKAPGLPPSSVIEIQPSLAALKENVELMATIDGELLGVIAAPAPDYATIVTDASDIRRLAVRLLRNLALPRSAKQAAPENVASPISAEQLDAYVFALNTAVKSFLDNPVLTQPRTVDAKLLSDAGADLETIVDKSASVQKRAEALVAFADKGKGKSSRALAPVRSRLKPRNSIQLTLECDAWSSISELLARPAEVKGLGSVNVGINAQARSHRLAQQLVVPIEDCVDGDADESARANDMRYVAIVKVFTSYEVKGKTFAYQVGCEIGLTKDGEIIKRLAQPVWFYYVDEGGDGAFDLFRGAMRYGFVPDWAKELAGKR